MKKNVPKSNSGRSMIEMLGVLAVIGILSIVGLWGYRFAIAKNESNEISEGLRRARISILTTLGKHTNEFTIQEDGTPTNQSLTFLDKNHGLDNYDPVGVVCTKDSFDIVLHQIKPDVCRRLVDAISADFAIIDVQNATNANRTEYCRRLDDISNPVVTACDTANEDDETLRMVFSFEKDENAPITRCTNDADCLSGICTDGLCETPPTECDPACGPGEVCNNGTCACAGFTDDSNRCYPCDDPDIISPVSPDSCKKCGTQRVTNGYDACAPSCPPDYFMARWESDFTCVSCDAPEPYYSPTAPGECSKCGSKRYQPYASSCFKSCPPGQLSDQSGYCYDCGDIVISVDESECRKCPDNIFDPSYMGGGVCLPKCPTGFFRTEAGCSAACMDPNPFTSTEQDCMTNCSNREWFNGECYLKTPCDGFKGYDGTCYPCNTASSVYTSDSQCALCPNRENLGNLEDTGCIIKLPPCENGLRDSNGNCVLCDYEGDISTTYSQCKKCPNRIMRQHGCLLPPT